MSRIFKYPLLYILLLTPLTLLAQKNIFTLNPEMKGLELDPYFEYLVEDFERSKTHPLDINSLHSSRNSTKLEFQGKSYHWVAQSKQKFATKKTNNIIWLRLFVHNPQPEKVAWYLQQKYPLMDSIKLYFPNKKGNYKSPISLGDTKPFGRRPIIDRSFIFPIKSNPAKTEVYYLRIETTSTMVIVLRAWVPRLFYQVRSTEASVLWLFYGALVVMLIYNLFVYFSVRDYAYLLYVLFTLFLGIFSMAWNGMGFRYLWSDLIWLQAHAIPIFIAFGYICFNLFTRRFLDLKHNWKFFDRVTIIMATLLLVLAVISVFAYGLGLKLILVGILVSNLVAIIVIVKLHFKNKLRQARFLGIALFSVLVGSAVSIMGNFGVLPSNILTRNALNIGLACMVLLMSLGLADRINTLKRDLQVLNVGLEDKVKDRTKKLERSFSQIKNLHEQQNADYFLTSLLLKPLSHLSNKSELYNIDFIDQQKKSFLFKGKKLEIGGDISIIDTIQLKDEQYILFINADAMGKSLQGAGGALVLGSVFNSIQKRTHNSLHEQDRFPEKWLKESYLELQDVFVTFEGSMLISAVLGLIHENSGFVYFLNSEHPYPVVYDGKNATFLESPILNKIGTQFEIENLTINTYQMNQGEVLFLGSDGRDDLLIGKDESGEREINYDETQFLRSVEKGKGKLQDTLSAIAGFGDFTDDTSLLRMEFQAAPEWLYPNKTESALIKTINQLYKAQKFEEAKNALEAIKLPQAGYPIVNYLRACIFLKLKDYEQAALYFVRVCKQDPSNTKAIYYASYAIKLKGEYESAIEHGERLAMREPENGKNILNLADSYRLSKNPQKTRELLDALLKMEPNNSRALELRNIT